MTLMSGSLQVHLEAKLSAHVPLSSGKAILFPIINDLISYEEYNHLKTKSELCSYAKSDLDEATVYKASVDGAVLHKCFFPFFTTIYLSS